MPYLLLSRNQILILLDLNQEQKKNHTFHLIFDLEAILIKDQSSTWRMNSYALIFLVNVTVLEQTLLLLQHFMGYVSCVELDRSYY